MRITKKNPAMQAFSDETFAKRQELRRARTNPVSDIGQMKMACKRREALQEDVRAYLDSGGRVKVLPSCGDGTGAFPVRWWD